LGRLNFPPTELWPRRAAAGRNVAAVRWARGRADVLSGVARAVAAAALLQQATAAV